MILGVGIFIALKVFIVEKIYSLKMAQKCQIGEHEINANKQVRIMVFAALKALIIFIHREDIYRINFVY